MRRVTTMTIAAGLCLLLGAVALAHDPRTTAKDFQSVLVIEGAGKALIEYKAMHFNRPTYDRMKTNDQFRERMSGSIWNNIGKARLEFEIVFGDVKLAKGDYEFGVDIGPNDTFSLVFKNASGVQKIPLKTISGDNLSGEYLSVSLTPTADVDRFTIEARCGPFRSMMDFQVPYLASHDHPAAHPPAVSR